MKTKMTRKTTREDGRYVRNKSKASRGSPADERRLNHSRLMFLVFRWVCLFFLSPCRRLDLVEVSYYVPHVLLEIISSFRET